MVQKQKGFIQLPFLVIGLFILAATFIPVQRNYNNGKSSVAGVSIAEDGSGGGDGQENPTGAVKPPPTEMPEMHQPDKQTPTNAAGEFMQGGTKVQYQIQDNHVEIQTESPNGQKTHINSETGDNSLKQVEAEMEKEGIRVATAPGQMALVNKRTGALTNFPISVDPTTRQLTVTTPAGVKIVAVLPQQAVDNMLAAHVMDSVIGEKVNNSLASIPNITKLEVQNGVLGYQISGVKNHKLLGFIPIQTGVSAFVSAENGQVVTSSESLLGRILDKIAP